MIHISIYNPYLPISVIEFTSSHLQYLLDPYRVIIVPEFIIIDVYTSIYKFYFIKNLLLTYIIVIDVFHL